MGNARRVMLLSFCWVGVGSTSDATAQADPPALTIRAHVEPGLDASWLPAAQAITRKIFTAAGMRLVWIGCEEATAERVCHSAPGSNEFVARIQARRADSSSHACGVSLRPQAAPGHYITVFLDCVREGAEAFEVPGPVVLAHAIAHEIGHLLLPVGHSPAGIMRARPDRRDWQRATRGALEFHPSDRKRIAMAMARRLGSVRQ